MKKIFFPLSFLLFAFQMGLRSQEVQKVEVYLLTCGPGTETYSVYGHSALRIVIPEKNSDLVYNWGVFDFSTPNFTWKFAKGRLDYLLGVYPYERFLQEYLFEQRWIKSQRINLAPDDVERLFVLLADNLKPENIKYRYDFFYDDCSTRIRDLLEKSVGEKLLYPPDVMKKKLPTFRTKVGEYQKGFPWMKFGVDLIMGSPGDKKASFRDRMFLPIDLQIGLSELVISREGKMVPLLQNPQLVLDFDTPVIKENFFTTPIFVFSLLLVIILILAGMFRGEVINRVIDISVFSVFSILAVLMIFFNFFTDHQQMRWNLNIIWLNLFIFFCLVSLIINKNRQIWYRITFFLAAGFLVFLVFLPQHINNASVPLIIILIMRSSVRAGFSWNPLSLPHLT